MILQDYKKNTQVILIGFVFIAVIFLEVFFLKISQKNIVNTNNIYNGETKYLDGVLLVNSFFVLSKDIQININNKDNLLWGAYVGDGFNDLKNFEELVGKKIDLYADFEGWNNNFPSRLAETVGQQGKTLIIFWEPNFGYDEVINGSKDEYIKRFANDAKKYSNPIILVPFDEMNINEEDWGYGMNQNSAEKFKLAWLHIHNLFEGVPNVKWGIAFNSQSIPNISGNLYSDYYPGGEYVDYVGVDGFNFKNKWMSFETIFDEPIAKLQEYNKPILIFSLAGDQDQRKAKWIENGLGGHVKTYKNLVGWVWFNEKNDSYDWRVNSDAASLEAFKKAL